MPAERLGAIVSCLITRPPWFRIGLLIAGPLVYSLEALLGCPTIPWYLPCTATCAALLTAPSLRHRCGHGLLFASALALSACEWGFVLTTCSNPTLGDLGTLASAGATTGDKIRIVPPTFPLFGHWLPDYTGPLAIGEPFPEFATVRAGGGPLTNDDLCDGHLTVLVFFRGRW